MCFVIRNAKLSKFINNENFCKKEKKEIDRSRDVTGMVDNMHSNLTLSNPSNHSAKPLMTIQNVKITIDPSK